ncbi:hypothetical protein GCM10008967_10670 [Bacillus carboniphilus]|uniref:Uncharacterized protein n=1 Tax=Bacillus carboniphilus TaxID=86663 RepID=A0ABN0W0R1_9BACI
MPNKFINGFVLKMNINKKIGGVQKSFENGRFYKDNGNSVRVMGGSGQEIRYVLQKECF